MTTALAYVLTIALPLFAITAIPIALLGALLGRMAGMALGLVVASTIIWQVVALAWRKLEGGSLPIAAGIAAIAVISFHGRISKTSLNRPASMTMSAEVWGIVATLLFGMVGLPIRWI